VRGIERRDSRRVVSTGIGQSALSLLHGQDAIIVVRQGRDNGRSVLDTSKPDDPNNQLGQGNSYDHFKNKTVNENHNSRVAIFSAQQFPCGLGIETKFSTSDNQDESYVSRRLGIHLDSEGTARISTKQ